MKSMLSLSGRSKFILRVALSVALLAALLKFVPFDDVVANLRGVDWRLLVFGVLWFFVERLFAAQRMRFISGQVGMSHSALALLRINLMTSFYGMFLPGHIAGGAIRWKLMSDRDKMHEAALAAMIFDRLNDLSILITLTCVTIILAPDFSIGDELNVLVITAVIVLPLVYALLFSRVTGHLARRLLSRFESLLPEVLSRFGRKLLDAVATFYGMTWRFRLRGWLLSGLSHVSGSVAFVFWAQAVGFPVSWAELFVARALLTVAMLFPVTVAGLGVREGLLLALFNNDASSSVILAFSGLVFSGLIAVSLAGGVLVLLSLWRGLSNNRSGSSRE